MFVFPFYFTMKNDMKHLSFYYAQNVFICHLVARWCRGFIKSIRQFMYVCVCSLLINKIKYVVARRLRETFAIHIKFHHIFFIILVVSATARSFYFGSHNIFLTHSNSSTRGRNLLFYPKAFSHFELRGRILRARRMASAAAATKYGKWKKKLEICKSN